MPHETANLGAKLERFYKCQSLMEGVGEHLSRKAQVERKASLSKSCIYQLGRGQVSRRCGSRRDELKGTAGE